MGGGREGCREGESKERGREGKKERYWHQNQERYSACISATACFLEVPILTSKLFFSSQKAGQ